jgi:uncharacterized membrane protein
MAIEIFLIAIMAFVTAGLRFAGFAIAHFFNQYPRAKAGLTSSGFCLITSFLAVQLWEKPILFFPVLICLVLSYISNGILMPLFVGWGALVGLLNLLG